jgi:hypothetical protein
MTSFIRMQGRAIVVLMVLAAPAAALAQDSTRGNASTNGIPQQIAVLQQQLSAANAAISRLQTLVMKMQGDLDMATAALEAEASARQEADSMLQASIDLLASTGHTEESRLIDAIKALLQPQYLLAPPDHGAEDVPVDTEQKAP